MRDPIVELYEFLCDAELQRQADDYWDYEDDIEDEERFDEGTGPTH